MDRREFLTGAVGAAVVSAVGGLAAPADARSGARGRRDLKVGILTSVSGEFADFGAETLAAVEFAADEVAQQNRELKTQVRIQLYVGDTHSDPETALAEMKRISRKGVKAFIGPVTSTEAETLLPYANQKGLLLISPSSTAGPLAIPEDNLLRLCPTDVSQGRAVAALLYSQGIRAVVPIWRGDVYGDSTTASFSTAFQALGGIVGEGIRYSPTEQEFAGEAAGLRTQVVDLKTRVQGGAVGVYLSGFEEVIHLFEAARQDAVLGLVRWYGSDGVTRSTALANDPEAAAFAAQAGFPSPAFGLDETSRSIWEPVAAAIHAQTGTEPDSFVLAAYDAMWLIALADRMTRGKGSVGQRREAFEQVASRYIGATGWTKLDADGDRNVGNYDFWALQRAGSGFEWHIVASYINGSLESH